MYNVGMPSILSKPLSQSLGVGREESNLTSRQFHARISWELQEHLEGRIQVCEDGEEEAVPQHGSESFGTIALCIVSFPSLSVDVRKESEVDRRVVVLEALRAAVF